MPPATKPTRQAKPNAAAATRVRVEDLTPDERAALLEELRADQATKAAGVHPERDLTPRERAIRGLLRERDHLEGCPIIDGPEQRAVGRVEGYTEIRPANPLQGRPAEQITVARCIECGGVRYLEGALEANLIKHLEAGADNGEDLDTDLD